MAHIQFRGRVFPLAVAVSIDPQPPIVWVSPVMTSAVSIAIKQNAITVDCEISGFKPEGYFSEILKRAFDITRVHVDTKGFSSGTAFTVLFEEATIDSGVTVKIVEQNAKLASLCTVITPANYLEMCRLICAEPQVFTALRDLMESGQVPHRASLNVARSFEAMRVFIAPHLNNKRDRSKAWALMGKHLNVSEDYLTTVSDPAKAYRHGDFVFTGGDLTWKALTRGFTVMNRFLEYYRRGKQPLPITEFPLLVG